MKFLSSQTLFIPEIGSFEAFQWIRNPGLCLQNVCVRGGWRVQNAEISPKAPHNLTHTHTKTKKTQTTRRVKCFFFTYSSRRKALLCHSLLRVAASTGQPGGLQPLQYRPNCCCWPQGCSCRAKLCCPSPGVEFLRKLSRAYQALFRGDELLLIVLFMWVKYTIRICVRLHCWLRHSVVIHWHASVIIC